ncbi:MAG: hypothetical protein KME43_04815 [Myxacorys chilensis ATA2-1-KO14]|jgi:hypothetical protein|nr:hypothetical protein [Myxacorys chilensis ATA2-1-KO14]
MVWIATSATTSTAIAGTLTQINQTSTSTQQSTDSSQNQTTTINLDSTELKTPCILEVSATANTELSGTITVNGKIIRQFRKQGATLNLSPYLSRGKQTIKILGRYAPAQSSVQVQFTGLGTQISQQTGGNGVLTQTLVINVI